MDAVTANVSINGNTPRVAEVIIQQRRIVCSGRWIRIAKIFDEPWLDVPPIENPDAFVVALEDRGVKADIFTFGQQLPEVIPNYATDYLEWDNVAVAPASNFNAWWESLPQESRKNVRRSQKRGVSVKPVEFNDELVRGIKEIYDETPYRQGRRFWHYGKDLETIRRENSSYLERSQFIGAFLEGKLIGFLKMVYTGPTARIMQILSMNQHFDKNPANALITGAIDLCAKRPPVAHFIYGQYVYGNKPNSSVTEFKRRNGFQQVLLPRYYIPMTAKGKAALALGLHRGIGSALPEPVINFLLDTRTFVYERLLPRSDSTRPAKSGSRSSP